MELQIFGEIDDLTEQMCQIQEAQEDIELVINSPGGSALEAFQLLNIVEKCEHNVTARIEVMAASAAAVIALGCPNVKITAKDIVMLHNCWSVTVGDANEHEQQMQAMKAVDNALQLIVTQYCSEENAQYIRSKMNEGELWLTGEQVAELFDNVELVEIKSKIGNLAAKGGLDTLVARLHELQDKVAELEAQKEEEPKETPEEEETPEEPKEEEKQAYIVSEELKALLTVELE